MILRAALTICLLCLSVAAHAAAPSEAQIDRLLEVMRARQTMDAILPQLMDSQQRMVEQMAAEKQLSAEQRQRFDRILAKTHQRVSQALTWEKLQPLYRDIYGKTFSAEDVEATIGFYSTPAGQNLLDKMPTLMQNTMAAMQALVVPVMKDLQADIEAELASDQRIPETGESEPATP